MIPKSHFNLLLALAFFFLSLLAFVYITQQYQIQLLQSQLLKLQSPAPVLSPTPSSTFSSDTSTWQTYKNDKFGFELKYPPTIYVENRNIMGLNDVSILLFSQKPPITNDDPVYYKHHLFSVYSSGGLFDSFLKNNFSNPPVKNVSVNNYQFSCFFVNNAGNDGNYFCGLIPDKNKNGFIYIRSSNENVLNNPIFLQILSTFKFTN